MVQVSHNTFSVVSGNANYVWGVPADVFCMNVTFRRNALCVRLQGEALCVYDSALCRINVNLIPQAVNVPVMLRGGDQITISNLGGVNTYTCVSMIVSDSVWTIFGEAHKK